MPRDINGNYTLPAGNPVVGGTTIATAWGNPTMADIASALTGSLSRSGLGGMLVPFKNTDGTMAAPGMSWVNEPSSGVYRSGLNEFRYSVGNEDILIIRKTGIELVAGKTALGIVTFARVQDTEPVTPAMRQGEQWFESDTGSFIMRYQNPDLTFTFVALSSIGGDFVPASGLNTLGNFVDDVAAAAGGVAIGRMYRNGSVLMVRVT